MKSALHLPASDTRARLFALATMAGVLLAGPNARANSGLTLQRAGAGPDANGATVVVATTPQPIGKARNCARIRRVEVKGVILIEDEDLRQRLAPIAARCIGDEDVKAIVAAINELYAERGYITTQAYLPEQDLVASGILQLNVIAGRIDKVVYREKRGEEALGWRERFGKSWAAVKQAEGPWGILNGLSEMAGRIDDPLDDAQLLPRELQQQPKLWTSFLAQPGEVVEIDRVQHGVDQLNRVASHHAEVKLEPGSEPATSVLAVENAPEDSFRVLAGYELNGADINGSGNTVPTRLRLDVAKDNLIGINDAWRVSYAGGLDSNEIRGGFSMPFRRFTMSFDAGYSESLSELAPGVEMFTRDGNASTSLSYLVYRDKSRQTTLETSLSWRTNERFVEGVLLEPQVVVPLRFGLSETRTVGDSIQISYGLSASQGLIALGAIRDPGDIDNATPRAQFFKMDGQGGIAKALDKIGLVRLDVNGQWSEHPLYSDDQLVLGSVATVRALPTALSGSIAALSCGRSSRPRYPWPRFWMHARMTSFSS